MLVACKVVPEVGGGQNLLQQIQDSSALVSILFLTFNGDSRRPYKVRDLLVLTIFFSTELMNFLKSVVSLNVAFSASINFLVFQDVRFASSSGKKCQIYRVMKLLFLKMVGYSCD